MSIRKRNKERNKVSNPSTIKVVNKFTFKTLSLKEIYHDDKAYLVNTKCEILEIVPNNGKKFTYEELRNTVEGYVEIALLHPVSSKAMICNEEPYHLDFNFFVSEMFKREFFGNFLFVPNKMLNN